MNRLLKKALQFCKSYLPTLSDHSSYPIMKNDVGSIYSLFSAVSDNIETYELKQIVPNKLFKEYTEASCIARDILKRFSYSISETTNTQGVIPSFWIDMSRLYEVYVFSKLYEAYGENIKFQVKGYRVTALDFIKMDEKLIIDTKYKPHYDYSNKGIIEDVRQISAYARDNKILGEMEYKPEDGLLKCLIIYPEDNKANDYCVFDSKKDILEDVEKIQGYIDFYKLSVPLPKKEF